MLVTSPDAAAAPGWTLPGNAEEEEEGDAAADDDDEEEAPSALFL